MYHQIGNSTKMVSYSSIALYAQIYLRTSKSAGNEYFHNILRDLHDRREEHIESIRRQLEATKSLLGGMSYRPMDMWDHLREVKDDPHTIIVANPPTYFAGYSKISWRTDLRICFRYLCVTSPPLRYQRFSRFSRR